MFGHYRLIAPARAILPVDARHESATVPAGTILVLDGKKFNGGRLMEVLCEGREVIMFTDELKVKTEPA